MTSGRATVRSRRHVERSQAGDFPVDPVRPGEAGRDGAGRVDQAMDLYRERSSDGEVNENAVYADYSVENLPVTWLDDALAHPPEDIEAPALGPSTKFDTYPRRKTNKNKGLDHVDLTPCSFSPEIRSEALVTTAPAKQSRGEVLHGPGGRRRVPGHRRPDRKRHDRSPAGCPGRTPSGLARSLECAVACHRA